jgi:hypothetical protein
MDMTKQKMAQRNVFHYYAVAGRKRRVPKCWQRYRFTVKLKLPRQIRHSMEWQGLNLRD